MEFIRQIRVLSHQLTKPRFSKAQELVSWMGAIQAQDYRMSKWAIGIRLQSSSLHIVDEALRDGTILRTHVMRPTWHLVAAQDIRWMLALSAARIKSSSKSRDRDLEITEPLYTQVNNLIEKMLSGNNHLTRQEVSDRLSNEGIATNTSRMIHFMMRAEIEGIVCSGIDKGKEQTYALIDERVPPTAKLTKDEALARLASAYFQSHSPASLNDFVWWSGLAISEARHAISLIQSDLITEKVADVDLFLHRSYGSYTFSPDESLYLLPSFDEYLISYKDRTTVIDMEHHPKAFNKNGTFYPTIMHNGEIVGNWKPQSKKNTVTIESSLFKDINVSQKQLMAAESKYKSFVNK